MTAWRYWEDALAGKKPPLHEGDPQPGFYRWFQKSGYGAKKTSVPVAYWIEDGLLKCRVGDKNVSGAQGENIWISVGANPISEETYRAKAERGEPWPDEHELVPMGHNQPPEDNSFEGLQALLQELSYEANKIMEGPPIEHKDEADRVSNLADRLAELWKRCDTQRAEERKPFDAEIKRVTLKWSPLLLMAEVYKNLKYKMLTPWMKRQTEEAKRAAEEAAMAGEPITIAKPKVGTRGRAMTLRSFKRAEIFDYALCLAHFANSQTIKDTVQHLANQAVRAGVEVPGAKLKEEEKVV